MESGYGIRVRKQRYRIGGMEFDMKDQLIRQTIMTTQEDVKEIKDQLNKLEDKIDQLR